MALPRVIGHVAKLHSMGLGIYASAYGIGAVISHLGCIMPDTRVRLARSHMRWPGD